MATEARESSPLLPPKEPKPTHGDPKWHDVAICALAYALASLFVFTPLRKTLGSSSNKHIVATTSVWFHPVRSLGNLIEVIYFTLLLLGFAICVSLAITLLVQFLYSHHLPVLAEDTVLLLFLGAALGLVGFMKARANNPSFNTASSAAIIFLVTTLIKDDDTQRGAISLDRVLNYLKMVMFGAAISSSVSILFYRHSSVNIFREKAERLMDRYADLLDLLVHLFRHGAENQNSPENQDIASQCESINAEANALLSELKTQLQYASFEFALMAWKPRAKTQFQLLQATLWSLQRQSMHLGGMLHCISVTTVLLKQAQTGPRLQSRRYSSRWDSIGRHSDIASTLNTATASHSTLGHFHDVFKRLSVPLRTFSRQLSEFARSSTNTRRDADFMRLKLTQYTHSRDIELRDTNNSNKKDATSAAEDGLLATANLFAHLIQDLGEEILVAEGLWLDYQNIDGLPPKLQAFHVDERIKPFTQLTEALYPTHKASDRGVGPALWKMLRLFRSLDVQHGIRVGVGAILIALPALVPETRDTFTRWHGEWTLITFMIILARNLGSMTHNIPLRIIGTAIGALTGIAVSLACHDNELLLILSSIVVALLCYRRILCNKDPVLGRFILLTFNLVCLYGYSISHDDRDEDDVADLISPIYDIAFHRVVAVVTGVFWAVFMIVTFWPHSARRALRSNLCIQWMRMGMTWKRDPVGIVWPNAGGPARFRGIDSERELQEMMLDLDALLKNAPNEFRLRGKFDPEPYKHMLESTQVILDAFHSINILIRDEPMAAPKEMEIVASTANERQELCNSLFLQFYTASTSVRLGFPVPEYLPEPTVAIDRLAQKLMEQRRALLSSPENNPCVTNFDDQEAAQLSISKENYDFVLFHSYLLSAITISGELRQIHEALRSLFGTLDDDLLFSYV